MSAYAIDPTATDGGFHLLYDGTRADMFPVTAAEFNAEGTANILVNKCISLWGCPRTILSDDGLQFCSKSSQAVQQLLGVRKLATSSYHPNGNGGATSSNRPNGNGGVERVNHTMAQMLAIDFFFVLPTTPFVR